MSNSIKITNINKSFQDKNVLVNYSAEMPLGQITCIMGPSGCGKTTLFNIMLGLLQADSGQISGLENKKFTALFQEDRLCTRLNAISNIKIVAPKELQDKNIKKHLVGVGLTGESLEQPVGKLSGGMKRRVALVRAIMPSSDIIFMDEPFKGLDEKTRLTVLNYVKKNTQNKTVIIITHDIDDVTDLHANLIEMPLNIIKKPAQEGKNTF